MKPLFMLLVVISASLVLSSCGSKDKKTTDTPAKADTTVTSQPVKAVVDSTLGPARNVIEKELSGWTKSFRNFNIDSFKMGQLSEFGVEDYGQDDMTKYYDLYKVSLAYAPDSNQFIDLYSYGLTLEKRGKKIYAIADVDNGVLLYNVPAKQWNRIAFFGPSAWVEEAIWTSPTTFVLAGVGPSNNSDDPTAFLMLGDTNSKTFRWFESNATRPQSTKYDASGMKKLKIDEWE